MHECIMNYELFTTFASLNKKLKIEDLENKQKKYINYGKDS